MVEKLDTHLQSGKGDHKRIGGKAMRASAFLMFGVVYNRLIALATTVLLARILSPGDFGLVAIGSTLLTILSTATDISLSNALIHHKDVNKSDFDTAFTLSVLRGLILAAVIAGSGELLASAYNDQRLVPICWGLAIQPIISGLGSPRFVLLSKGLSFGTVAIQEGLNFTAQLIVAVAVANLTGSYWAIVAGATAGGICGTILSYVSAPYRPSFSLSSVRKLMSFSIWLTFNQFVSAVGNRFDNFLAGAWLGIDVFGAYNVGSNAAGIITQSAVQPLQRVLFPSFSLMAGDDSRLNFAFQRSQAALLAVGLAAGLGQALIAESMVYLALGPHWSVAALVIQVIAPVLGAQIIFGPANALATAKGYTRALFNRAFVLLCFRVPVVFIGLYYFGLYGLLISRVISGGIAVSIVNFYMVRQITGITPWQQLVVTWRSWASGALMVAAVLFLQSEIPPVHDNVSAAISMVSSAMLGAIVYVGGHAALWLMSGRSPVGIESEVASLIVKFLKRARSGN